jgi:hypothetical protein
MVDMVSTSSEQLLRGLESPLCHEMERGFRGEDLENCLPPLNAVLPCHTLPLLAPVMDGHSSL